MGFFDSMYYGNTVETWSIAIGIVLAAFILGKIVYWIFGNVIKKLTDKTETKIDDIIVDMIEEPIMLAIMIGGAWYSVHYILTLSEGALNLFSSGLWFVIILNIAWLITRLFDSLFKEYIVPLADKTEGHFDDQILPIIRKGVNISIWTLAVIIALDNAGYNIGALLAGLGIGGLLLAMAAKDTVANIFGGITIFLDKPFKIKDRIRVDGFDGTVVEVGIRSTRVKTLAGTVVTIPNSKFSDNSVENVTLEPSRKVVLNLGLTYDTSEKNMELAVKLLQDIVKKNKHTLEDNYVGFSSFGDFALGILVIYYIKKGSDIVGTQHEMNMEILKQFNKNKLEFAFPTQTIFNKKG